MDADHEISRLHGSPGPENGRNARAGAPLCDQYFREIGNTGRPVVCGTCPWTCFRGKELRKNEPDGNP